jgi:1-acyl-sn-glycerol-3-phosphate acyltransferase
MIKEQEFYPTYPPDYQLGGKLTLSILFSRRRSFRSDASNWIKSLKPPLMIHGKENIPLKNPFLLVINHYYRPKYKAWWSVLAASALIPVEIHWVMAAAWTFPNRPMGHYLESISRIIFKRAAEVYGFFVMPPMPPRSWETQARALAVRSILGFVKKNENAAIGLAPEGGDSQTGTLEMPAPGSGRFLLHLAQSGLVIHPLGIYEANGVLHLNFGKSVDLKSLSNISAEERDRWGSQVVMQALAELLPDHLRGVY